MTPTHEQVLAAIDKARDIGHSRDCDDYRKGSDQGCDCEFWERDTHCDDLRDTAERHVPDDLGGLTIECLCCVEPWPCPDYRQVIDRLTAWGAL